MLLLRSATPSSTVPLLLELTIGCALGGAILLSSTFPYRVLRERGLMTRERLMGMLLVMVAVRQFELAR